MNVSICEVCKKIKVKGVWIEINRDESKQTDQEKAILSRIRLKNKKGEITVEHVRCPDCVPW